MRVLSFFLIEALLSPLTLTSFLLLQLWAIPNSKHQQISITALAPLFSRWLLHVQGIRPDAATHALVDNLSALNTTLCWGSVGPTLFAANLTGYTPNFLGVPPVGKENLSNMIYTRSLFFDRAIARYLPTAEQIVILGAGFDTRLFKFCLNQGLTLFEVDQFATQQAKIQALRKSGIDLRDINFVSVDFTQKDWADRLQQTGFRVGRKSFFLWEGVTYYLTESVVKETLATVSEISGEGSAIAFDVFSSDFVSATGEWQWIQPAIKILDIIGEPFRFGINLETDAFITRLLNDASFQIQTFQPMGSAHRIAFSGLISAVKVAQ